MRRALAALMSLSTVSVNCANERITCKGPPNVRGNVTKSAYNHFFLGKLSLQKKVVVRRGSHLAAPHTRSRHANKIGYQKVSADERIKGAPGPQGTPVPGHQHTPSPERGLPFG